MATSAARQRELMKSRGEGPPDDENAHSAPADPAKPVDDVAGVPEDLNYAAADASVEDTAVLDAVSESDNDEQTIDSVAANEAESGSAPEQQARRRFVVSAFVLLTVVVILLASGIVAGLKWNAGRVAEDGRADALAAARQAAVNLTSINFASADSDVRRVLDGATGDFGGLFAQNLDSYVNVVKDGQVVTTGAVTEAGLEKFDGQAASAMVAVRTSVKNKSVPNGEDRFYRLVEQMQLQNGRWLVAKVEFVP